MSGFLAAIQFLTTIPVPGRHDFSPEKLGRSAGYFPVIGVIIGLILAGLSWLFGLLLPSEVTNALLITFMVIASGGLHLDGFVDTCDGIGGQKPVEDRWRAMSDSQAGSFGIIGVLLLLLVKYAALNSVPANSLLITLVMMPMLSRWAIVYAVFTYKYAKPTGLGRALKESTRWLGFTVATVVTAVMAMLIAQLIGLAIMVVVWVVTVVAATYFKGKFSGLTGDNYGAINEIIEVSVLLFISLLATRGLF